MNRLLQIALISYIVVGGITSMVSLGSVAIFYILGPGAIWEIGFLSSTFGFAAGLFFAALRAITWPMGLYILISNPAGFSPWLFYLWY